MARLLLLHKPYGVLSQFRSREGRPTLADYLPLGGVYAAGRLDADSEGLLLLTDDGRLQARLADPRFTLEKTYWVQVEGAPTPALLDRLRSGVVLRDGRARAVAATQIPDPGLPTRAPPIRVRKSVPTAWLEIVLTEGRNRQVRRMTAAVGLPTLRLVRAAVGPYRLGALRPGEWQEADPRRLR